MYTIPSYLLGFIDVIVIPTYEVMGNMIDLIMVSYNKICKESGSPTKLQYDADFKPWSACLNNNKKQWKDKCSTKGIPIFCNVYVGCMYTLCINM